MSLLVSGHASLSALTAIALTLASTVSPAASPQASIN